MGGELPSYHKSRPNHGMSLLQPSPNLLLLCFDNFTVYVPSKPLKGMSGAETVAGLVLGVLPLLVVAAEHYDQCFRPFVRYKKIAKEADHFRDQLNIQKTIFRNQCRLLLEQIVEHDAAARMLKGPDDPLWHDAALDAKLNQLLGESREACVAAIKIIEQRLQDIQNESEELWTALDAEHQVPNPSGH